MIFFITAVVITVLLCLIYILLEENASNKSFNQERLHTLNRELAGLRSELTVVYSQHSKILGDLETAKSSVTQPETSTKHWDDKISRLEQQVIELGNKPGVVNIQSQPNELAGQWSETIAALKEQCVLISKDLAVNKANSSAQASELLAEINNLKNSQLDSQQAQKHMTDMSLQLDQLRNQCVDLRKALEQSPDLTALEGKINDASYEQMFLSKELAKNNTLQRENIRLLVKRIEQLDKNLNKIAKSVNHNSRKLAGPLDKQLKELKNIYSKVSGAVKLSQKNDIKLISGLKEESQLRLHLKHKLDLLNERQRSLIKLKEKVSLLEKKIAGYTRRDKPGNPKDLAPLVTELADLKHQYESLNRKFASLRRSNEELSAALAEPRVTQAKIVESVTTVTPMLAVEPVSPVEPVLPVEPVSPVEPGQELSNENNVISMRQQLDRRIAGSLLKNNVIDQKMFDDAFEYDNNYGGGMVHALIIFGYLSEDILASFISSEFSVPYASVKTQTISAKTISALPLEIAQQYCALPLNIQNKSLNVIMANPLDALAIKHLEQISGFKIQPHLGTVSDILGVINQHYQASFVKLKSGKIQKVSLTSDSFKLSNVERRLAQRFALALDSEIFYDGRYRQYKTKDISAQVITLSMPRLIPIGTKVELKINIPQSFYPVPIEADAQVMRITPAKNGFFDVKLRFTWIEKQTMVILLEYAKKTASSVTV